MKALYFTDLHGSRWKRERAAKLAIAQKVNVVIDGGDILPYLDDDVSDFIENAFRLFCASLNAAGITFLFMAGNDDPLIFDQDIANATRNYPLVYGIAQRKISLGRYDFIGMNWVNDYHFRLKDRCRLDYPGAPLEQQDGPPVIYGQTAQIESWEEHVRQLPTLRDELRQLPKSRRLARPVYIIHMPPYHLGLAMANRWGPGMVDVGSKSVYDFIKKRQPWLTFHGHIHESPELTSVWKRRLGKTLCIQPGQKGSRSLDGDRLVYVLIDLETRVAKRFEETPPI